MNAVQQRFLLNRLDEARRSKPSRYDPPKLAETAAVVKARKAQADAKKVLEDWQKQIDRVRDARNKAVDMAFNVAKTAVLFNTTEEAIKAIEKFEKTSSF